MFTVADPKWSRCCRLWTRSTGVLAVVIGGSVLLGWLLHVPLLTSILPGAATMKPATALCFTLAGVSLWLLSVALFSTPPAPAGLRRTIIAQCCNGVIVLIGWLTLGSYLLDSDRGLVGLLCSQTLAITGQMQSGRMSSGTALGFGLLGLALACLAARPRRSWPLDQYLALVVILLGGLGFEGYLFDAQALYRIALYASMAVHTALLFVILSTGVLCARPDTGIMAVITSPHSGGLVARRFLPLVILLPIMGGELCWQGELAGWYDTSFGVVLFVTATIMVLSSVVWVSARQLNGMDAARQRADRSRQENEARLAGIISSAMDGIIMVDDQQRIVLFNPAAETMFGYRASDMLGRPLEPLLPERFRRQHAAYIRTFGATNQTLRQMGQLGAVYGLRVTGEEFPIEASISQIELAGQKLFTVILRDVTERQRAQAEVSEWKNRYEAATQASGQILYDWDSGSNAVIYGGDLERILGYSAEEIGGELARWLQLVHPADRDLFNAEIARVLQTGESFALDFRVVRKDGAVIDVRDHGHFFRDAHGQGHRMVGFVADITAHKRAEEALRDSEFRFRQLTESLPQLIWTCRGDGSCDYLSPQWVTYTGVPEAVQLDSGWVAQLHPDDREPTLMAWQHTVKAAGNFDLEFRMRRHDGTYRWFKTQAVPLRDVNGIVVKWFGANTDIEDHKQIEAALRLRTEDLLRSNAELEQFAYVASHDLQEPLRAVAGCVQLLRRRYQEQLDARADELIMHAVEGATRMRQLIDDLLAFSRVGTRGKTLTSVSSAQALQAALTNLTVAIQESGTVVTHDTLPMVHADLVQLSSLLQNLLDNAMKFRRETPPHIHVGIQRQDTHWVFSVRDNGIGIEPQYFDRIFTIFQRLHTRTEYAGTGIGLALCKKIVERHGGRIWIESVPGSGSTFFFSLPAPPDSTSDTGEIL